MQTKLLALSLTLTLISVSTVSAQEYYDSSGLMGGVAVGNSSGAQEQLYPYDSPEPWLHGYWQDMPYYGGFRSFRPYNYKQVLSQSQTAAGWGMNPKMPYSQQFWHRYHAQSQGSPYQTYGYAQGQGTVIHPKQPGQNAHSQYYQAPIQQSPMQYSPQPLNMQGPPVYNNQTMPPPAQNQFPPTPVNVNPNIRTAPMSYNPVLNAPVQYPSVSYPNNR